jgi:membrane dipeptidase
MCLSLLDVARRWEQDLPDRFRVLRRRTELTDDFVGCRALLTVEGLGAIGESLSWLEELRSRHVRAATLTWNGDNPWASGCFGAGGGLTSLGRRALVQLERLGIAVDVSHLNECGFWDVARLSVRPFFASHSNAAAVFPHPRNLTNDQFRVIRDGGGVVGLNLYGGHLGVRSQDDYHDAFRRHFDHFLCLGGEDIVCIGSDFDGMDIPAAWNGIGFIPTLYHFLLSCGYDTALLDKLFYQNARRFFLEMLP